MTHVNRRKPSTDGYSLLLAASFDGTTVAAVRHEVLGVAGRCRMSTERLNDFVLAVNEIMTNAVRHGGGTGHLRLWRDGDLVCQVSDHGSGFDAGSLLERGRPQPSSAGGMGIWIARSTSDDLTIESGPAGTTVDIRSHLSSGPRA